MIGDRYEKWIALLIFVGLPLLFAPFFLNFAQGAKTIAITMIASLSLLIFAVNSGRVSDFVHIWKPVPVSLQYLLFGYGLSYLISFGLNVHWQTTGELLVDMSVFVLALHIGSFMARRSLMEALAYGSTILSLLGIGQVAMGIMALVPPGDLGQFPAVTMGNRGLASLYCGVGIFACRWLMRQSPGQIRWFFGFIVSIIFVILAMTRSTWLGVLSGFLAWYFVDLRRASPAMVRFSFRRNILTVMMTLAVAAVLIGSAILYSEPLKEIFVHRLNPANWLENPRIDLWLHLLRELPKEAIAEQLFGHGPGSFQNFALASLHTLSGRIFLDAHNDVLQSIWEFGYFGLLVRICLLAGFLNYFWQKKRDVDVAIVTVFIVSGFFFYSLQLPVLGLVFATILLSKNESEILHRPKTKAYLGIRAVLLVVFLAVPYYTYHQFHLEMEMHAIRYKEEILVEKKVNAKKILDSRPFIPAYYRHVLETMINK